MTWGLFDSVNQENRDKVRGQKLNNGSPKPVDFGILSAPALKCSAVFMNSLNALLISGALLVITTAL